MAAHTVLCARAVAVRVAWRYVCSVVCVAVRVLCQIVWSGSVGVVAVRCPFRLDFIAQERLMV